MVDTPEGLSHHDWPWLIGALVLSSVFLVSLSVWCTLHGCVTHHFGLSMWWVLSLIATVGCSVQLARLHPHMRSHRPSLR